MPASEWNSTSLGEKRPRPSFAECKERRRVRRERQLIEQCEQQRQKREEGGVTGVSVIGGQRVRRPYTVCLAVAGSVLDNAQSAELSALLAGQIARTAAIFRVDEVVVFDDQPQRQPESEDGTPEASECCQHMAAILQYMECPQYLRKRLFPVHRHLRHVGVVSPLECPHHLRRDQASEYREGVVLESAEAPDDENCWVDVGLSQHVQANRRLRAGVRVTLKLADKTGTGAAAGPAEGRVVSPHEPSRRLGLYWGYTVRVAASLSRVFTESSHADGYDLLVGTSDRGQPLNESVRLPSFKHSVIVFGGLQGLEAALENDPNLQLDSPQQLFDVYVNACVDQGTRTIRTEEAVPIVMTALKPLLAAASNSTTPTTPAASETPVTQ